MSCWHSAENENCWNSRAAFGFGASLKIAFGPMISGVPSVVYPQDVAMVAAVAFVMCLLSTLYPAWRASRTDPATALRYE